MSKYILNLTAKNLKNNVAFECSTAQEAAKYKRDAEMQGYKVEVRKTRKRV